MNLICFVSFAIGSNYASNKVYPQCHAAVPVRQKMCKCCDHVFQKAECNLQEKAMKCTRDSVNQLGKQKISFTKPVKECQKLVSEQSQN